MMLFSLIISLGKFSPLFFLYIFPPLNFFRIPARFNVFTLFFASLVIAVGLSIVLRGLKPRLGKFVGAFVLLITVLDLFFHWWGYNLISKMDTFLSGNEFVRSIKSNDDTFLVQTFDPNINWNNHLKDSGWNNQEKYYEFFLNSLSADYNLIFGINHLTAYSALPLNRSELKQSVIHQDRNIQISNNKMELKDGTNKLLDLYGVTYLISSLEIESQSYHRISDVNLGKYNYYLYESQTARGETSLLLRLDQGIYLARLFNNIREY